MKSNFTAMTGSSQQPNFRGRRAPLALAFLGLVLIGLTQTGCRSNGCSNCNIGAKLSNGLQNVRERVFTRRIGAGNCSTCGTLGSYEEGNVIDSGIPVVTPGPGITTIPGPAGLAPAPIIESDPQLAPLPPAGGGTAGGSASSRNPSGTNRSAYEATRPRNDQLASQRGSDLTRAYQSTNPSPVAYVPEEPDILDHLPPVDLPPDVSSKVKDVDSDPLPEPRPGPKDPLVLPNDASTSPTTSAETKSAGGGFVAKTSRGVAIQPTRVVPGIARSASVAPSIAGGSLPSLEGLTWLREKGYRTLIDLRPLNEANPSFADQAIDMGITYIPLPFATSPISRGRLTRFNELLSQNESKPIYFCDADGRGAGLIWYLRLRSVDREEASSARSKAEEIGLLNGDLTEADRFLRTEFALTSDSDSPQLNLNQKLSWGAIETTSDVRIEPNSSLSMSKTAPVTTTISTLDRPSLISHLTPVHSIHTRVTQRTIARDQPLAWKPVAALVFSGFGVPLAYWSRTTLFQKRLPRRASLTAKEPGSRKAFPSSDV